MKRYAILTIASFIFSFIYFSLIFVVFGFLTPNFLIIIPISFMYKNKSEAAYFLAFVLGIFTDLLVGHYLGVTSIYLILLVAVFSQLKYRVGYVNVITAIIVFGGSLIYDSLLQYVIYGTRFELWQSLTQSVISVVFTFITIKALNLIPAGYWSKDSNVNK